MSKNKYGLLLAISSLPGKYGIGDFGISAYQFVDFLSKRGYRYWQILPLNPLGSGNSPYMSTSSEAIESRYIDLDFLVECGFLKSISYKKKSTNKVKYDDVLKFKEKYLLKAYKKFLKKPFDDFEAFKTSNPWVFAFATFLSFKKKFNEVSWVDWPDEYKFYYDNNPRNKIPEEYIEECNYEIFKQYLAHLQWKKLKEYANKHSIKIIADCPFYVGLESTDCWINKDEFVTDFKYKPTLVSGCPPDGFTEDGQLWGTPIYDFLKMSFNNYSFLINRICYLIKNCDILRLDHFRAFDTYCVIPAGDENAKRGEWRIGPREAFFNELFKKRPDINIIAEDLGVLFQSVLDLRDHYHLPGMNVLQFTLLDKEYVNRGCDILYTGTHDNQTLKGWVKKLSRKDKNLLKKKLHCDDDLTEAIINLALSSKSRITVLPLQDVLGLDDKSRMNTPGTMGSPNWEWKLKDNTYMDEVKYGL